MESRNSAREQEYEISLAGQANICSATHLLVEVI